MSSPLIGFGLICEPPPLTGRPATPFTPAVFADLNPAMQPDEPRPTRGGVVVADLGGPARGRVVAVMMHNGRTVFRTFGRPRHYRPDHN